jgi:hypothetical protein
MAAQIESLEVYARHLKFLNVGHIYTISPLRKKSDLLKRGLRRYVDQATTSEVGY